MPRSLYEPDDAALSRDAARALADRVLAMAKGDETRVDIRSGWTGNTRFARAEITTSGGTTDTSLSVTTTIGRRRASATTNVLDDDGLHRAVDLAERLTRLSPEDPELMPELGAQSYAAVNGYFDSTAGLSPEVRATAARQVIDAARETGQSLGDMFVAGFLDAGATSRAIATSRGLFAYHRGTDVRLSTTVRTPDATGSGWAGTGSHDWKDIDARGLGLRAAGKAVQSRAPAAIEPGMYTTVLEPAAVAQLVPAIARALDARSADEGRSPFSAKTGGTRIGEKIADERVTLFSDPADPELLAQPFDGEGLPVGRRVWIENGVLRNLSYSRYWAEHQGKQATGSGGGGGGFGGGMAGGLKMPGGGKSVAELVAGCQRGILVTHFFYTNILDARSVLMTGLTRDGLFLIENGKVTRAIKNFRWNESPLFMLSKIEEIGRAERTGVGQVMPSLRVRDFNFASLSDAV